MSLLSANASKAVVTTWWNLAFAHAQWECIGGALCCGAFFGLVGVVTIMAAHGWGWGWVFWYINSG